MNEGNIAAEAGVKDGVRYVEKNSLGTVIKQLIALEDLKPFQATEKSLYSFYLCLIFFIAKNDLSIPFKSPITHFLELDDH